MMRKHRSAAVREFTLAAWNQFGMHIVVLAVFMKEEGPVVKVQGP